MSFSAIWTSLFIIERALGIWVTVTILRRPRDPRGMLAWILTLQLMPFLGLFFFLLFGDLRKIRHRRRRRRRLHKLHQARGDAAERPSKLPADQLARMEPELLMLTRLARRLGAFPPTAGNDVMIYHEAEQPFLAIQLAIKAAQSHVHLEYYIFQADSTGRAVRDLLIEKARQGVKCRVLLDYVGCWRMPREFIRPMREAGVQVEFALPVIPWRGRWRVNFRNHRKIVVIDGVVGFTGSQNVGDADSGRLRSNAPRRDTHMKIVGPAVRHLQEVFIRDWHYTTREVLAEPSLLPPDRQASSDGGHIVQIVPSGPDQPAPVMHQMLFAAVSAARSSVRVITPYFVPDQAMVLALQSACYRGARVQLIIPACSDHRLVLWAGRSYYQELISVGVEVYEYDLQLLHSKVIIIDEGWATVGSANMDERSFRLNYELTTILYSPALVQVVYRDFEMLRDRSRRIMRKSLKHQPFREAMLLGLARLASPLL